jgi:hypothetical protein
MLSDQAPSHLLVIGDEQEGFGLGGTLGLHLLEAQVIVHHLSDLLNLTAQQIVRHPRKPLVISARRIQNGFATENASLRKPEFLIPPRSGEFSSV